MQTRNRRVRVQNSGRPDFTPKVRLELSARRTGISPGGDATARSYATRTYPEKAPEPEYPGHVEVRSVRQDGYIRWQGELLFVSEALDGERVGLEEVEDGVWSITFGPVLLARFDARERKLYG